ncbi:hypothetical protein BC828DRAFT_403797 [Blastocladiella britannica]|nr:hypothetical protein BC828DRAFT_403797 [Blastocladiella britannica]
MSSPSDSTTPIATPSSTYVTGLDKGTLADERAREEEFYSYMRDEALKGGAIGLAVGAAALFVGGRYSPAVRNIYTPYKFFLLSSAGMAGFAIRGEQATFDSKQSRYHYNKVLVEQANTPVNAVRSSPFATQVDWILEHKYHVTLGVWVAAMGGSAFMLFRNRNMNTSQKLTQARVYAQGAVLAALMATVGLETLAGKDRSSPAYTQFQRGPIPYPWEVEEQEALKVKAEASAAVPAAKQ